MNSFDFLYIFDDGEWLIFKESAVNSDGFSSAHNYDDNDDMTKYYYDRRQMGYPWPQRPDTEKFYPFVV